MDLKRIFKFKLKQIVGIRVCYEWGLVWFGSWFACTVAFKPKSRRHREK